jgi:hypothetical protein
MMAAAEGVGSARNCGLPAKTKTGWGSGAKETAVDTGRLANDQFAGMCAANCGKLVSTRISWANEAKAIAAGIGRRVEIANSPIHLDTVAAKPPAALFFVQNPPA